MKRACALVALLGLAATASANAAMGLGLEMFSMETWTIYVIVSLVFEAWFIGRFFQKGWFASIGISVVANMVTGFGCISICAVGLHQTFVGSRLNPNPFLNAIVLFTGFGIVSALIEAVVWAMFRVDRDSHNSLMWRSLLAHLIGVPLGPAILLIPSHPYVGTMAGTNRIRWSYLESRVREGLLATQSEEGVLPCFHSLPELLVALPTSRARQPDEWAACYEADLSRFAMGENRTKPIGELNPAICGLKLPSEDRPGPPGTIWVIRRREPDYVSGIVLDLSTGEVSRTIDPTALGYR